MQGTVSKSVAAPDPDFLILAVGHLDGVWPVREGLGFFETPSCLSSPRTDAVVRGLWMARDSPSFSCHTLPPAPEAIAVHRAQPCQTGPRTMLQSPQVKREVPTAQSQ